MTLWIVGLYAIAGGVAALVVVARRHHRPGDGPRAILVAVLWPFLLPAILQTGRTPAATQAGSPRAQRLDQLAESLRAGWSQISASGWSSDGRERMQVEAFIDRLRGLDVRLTEMDRALVSAPPSLQERLRRLRERSQSELDHGLGVLDELAAQMTLLRFVSVNDPTERDHVEELLARMGAVAEVSTSDDDRSRPNGVSPAPFGGLLRASARVD